MSLFFWSSKEITEILLTMLVKQACLPAGMLIHFQLFTTTWTGAHQSPVAIVLSWQEYRSVLPFSPPGIFPTQGSNPCLLCLLCFLHCKWIFFISEPLGKPHKTGQSAQFATRTVRSIALFIPTLNSLKNAHCY